MLLAKVPPRPSVDATRPGSRGWWSRPAPPRPGGNADTLQGIDNAFMVAPEHLGIGHEMLGQADGLRRLKMGAARQQRVPVLIGPLHEHADQRAQVLRPFIKCGGDKEPEIESHLIVAGAPGVQLLPRRADNFGQTVLDVHVHVFEVLPPDKGPGLYLRANLLQAIMNGLAVGRGDDALLGQHGRVGPGAVDILGAQPRVKSHGAGVALDQGAVSPVKRPPHNFFSLDASLMA